MFKRNRSILDDLDRQIRKNKKRNNGHAVISKLKNNRIPVDTFYDMDGRQIHILDSVIDTRTGREHVVAGYCNASGSYRLLLSEMVSVPISKCRFLKIIEGDKRALIHDRGMVCN